MIQTKQNRNGRQIRLTSLASCAGWASKLSAETLEQVLTPIKDVFQAKIPPQLLVGISSPDDAAVWQLDGDHALVLTTDFFTPVVDIPYDYGAIAAANSLSDIYAMGGEPFLALNIAAFPPDLPLEIIQAILSGAAEKTKEAGAVIAGGHTIQDKEPKFGLVVLGQLHTGQLLTKGAAQPGDHLILTKPLGFGIITTAIKQEKAGDDDIREVTDWMKRLNRDAARLARQFKLKAATDITGYSLLGHALELAKASQVGIRMDHHRIPHLAGAIRYAHKGCFPGGAFDNRSHFGGMVRFDNTIDEIIQMILFDPQTSGGLLLCVPDKVLPDFMTQARKIGQTTWDIGIVIPGQGIEVH